MALPRTTLGHGGPAVPVLALGCMGMSDAYGPADRGEAVATIHAALDAGLCHLDTGDFYGSGHNEMLLAEALRDRRREDVFIAVKFGALRGPDGAFIGLDCRPVAVRNALAGTLRRLGTDHVDLYQPARVDPQVPFEDTVGAVKELIGQGWVRHLGVSETSAESLRRAHAVHPVAALQIEYSLVSRGIERTILPTARELGIAVTAYGVLSRGLLGGSWSAARTAAATRDLRAHLPRFTGANLGRNLALVEAMRAVAAERGCSVAQLAVAWVRSRGPDIVPLVGCRTRVQLADTLGSLDVVLDAADLARLEAAVPPEAVAGTRYAAPQMAWLDSER